MKILFSTYLLFIAFSLSFSGVNKTPIELKISYPETTEVNYGHYFEINFLLIYSNEKSINITSREELEVTCLGAKYNNGKIYIPTHPASLSNNEIKVCASFKRKDFQIRDSIVIPFNYSGILYFNFRGKEGLPGEQYGRSGIVWNQNEGRKGATSGKGKNGEDGSDLFVSIWKDSIDFYFIKINNLKDSTDYLFKTKKFTDGLKFDVSGGQGGVGGTGGQGGNGRNGCLTENKNITPGNGGDGGMGGEGGNGGNGGSVFIKIHENAKEIKNYITVLSQGGQPGYGGQGGLGGDPGYAYSGQTNARSGAVGIPGMCGKSGKPNQNITIIVEAFEINY